MQRVEGLLEGELGKKGMLSQAKKISRESMPRYAQVRPGIPRYARGMPGYAQACLGMHGYAHVLIMTCFKGG